MTTDEMIRSLEAQGYVVIDRRIPREAFEARFWAKVDRNGDCWCWTGTRTRKGYGMFRVDRYEHRQAHRLSWELAHGRIPPGKIIMHRCDNPACVKPDHLKIGTILENNRDKVAKGRQARGATQAAGPSKLKPADVIFIRASVDQSSVLAKRFGVGSNTIRAVRSRRTWRHL